MNRHVGLLMCSGILALLGAYMILQTASTIFDRSYMLTLDVLGMPGAADYIRLKFCGGVLLLAISLAGFLVAVRSWRFRHA